MTTFRRSSSVAIAIVSLAFQLFAQKATSDSPKFDVEDFNKKFETVQWLVDYDQVAWKTTDVVVTEDKAEIAKLGSDWFCFQDKDRRWHAIYGKLEAGSFATVFHYVYGTDGKVTKTTEKLDQTTVDRYAKALTTSRSKLAGSIPRNSPQFNQYIRKNPDQTFDVWMLPAFQRDATAVYGGEAHYTIDSSGEKVLKEDCYFQKALRGFRAQPPREIHLDYQEVEKPTLGAIFFVWYYKSYFTNIYVDNSKSTSTVIDSGKDGYIWLHVDKSEKK